MLKNRIELTQEDRKELERFSTTGLRSAKLVIRAKIILALDTSNGRKAAKQKDIAQHLKISRQTINDTRRDFLAAKNIATFLQRKKAAKPPVPPKITGEVEAHIIALSCSEPPPGCAKWTLRLLANKCVELQYIDSISHVSVRSVLKKKS